MRLQNRVTPFGDIIATPQRGTFTGNRGIPARGEVARRPRELHALLNVLPLARADAADAVDQFSVTIWISPDGLPPGSIASRTTT
jgi:hypothetical protein